MYYCQIRGSYLLNQGLMDDAAIISTPYYIINILKSVIKMKNYPRIKSSHIYLFLMNNKNFKPNIEINYPLLEWNNI